jgi:hypothetical protein
VLALLLLSLVLSELGLPFLRSDFTQVNAYDSGNRQHSYASSLQPSLSGARLPLFRRNFTQVNEQGFGDRQNSYAWSMKWWNEKLYVGTNRAFRCVEVAAVRSALPDLPFPEYPPNDPDIECAPTPQDLPLQAEIWRYTPETETWERVYQSPNDIPIPDHPGKYVARDIGFRDMAVFTEPNGTEALYVTGVSSRDFNGRTEIPLPRLLRSTDGVTFESVPQDPGTVFGDLPSPNESMRTLEVYKGRLYVTVGSLYGAGALYEAADPAGGNDNFRRVSPEGMRVFEMEPFNGFLYVGTRDPDGGYAVVKTSASGTPPYTFTMVVPGGAYRRFFKSQGVISMFVFKNRLYVGTDKPAELIRINPDDTWDLIVGAPRDTPDGYKAPLSGMSDGFDWAFNVHMWRMGEYQDWLYVGTVDASTFWHTIQWADQLLRPHMGFDLFTTRDGWYFTQITRTGFDKMFDIGVRTFAATPHGLFFGTGNYYYGTRVYLGVPGPVYSVYLPIVSKGSEVSELLLSSFSSPNTGQWASSNLGLLPSPERLEAENKDGKVILSWERPPGARRFRIFRSEFTLRREFQNSGVAPEVWIPGPFKEIGLTDEFYFVDATARPDRVYHYYVRTEADDGCLSQPSNLVRVPNLAPLITFRSLDNFLARHTQRRGTETQNPISELLSPLRDIRILVQAGDLDGAGRRLEALRRSLADHQIISLKPWLAEDLEIMLGKLRRRIALVQVGLLSPEDLE